MKNLKQKIAAFLIAAMMIVTNTIVPVYAYGLRKTDVESNEYKILNGDLDGDLAEDGSIYHYAYDLNPYEHEYDNTDAFGNYRIEWLEEGNIDSEKFGEDYYPSGYYKIYDPRSVSDKYSENRFPDGYEDLVTEEDLNKDRKIIFDGQFYEITFNLKNIKTNINEESLFMLTNKTTNERKIFKSGNADFVASAYNGYHYKNDSENFIFNQDDVKYDETFDNSQNKKEILEKIDKNEPVDLDKLGKLDKLEFNFDKKIKSEYELKEVRTVQNRHRDLMPVENFSLDNTLYLLSEEGKAKSYIESPGILKDSNKEYFTVYYKKLYGINTMSRKVSIYRGRYLMRPVPISDYSEICNRENCYEPGNGAKDLLSSDWFFGPAGIGLRAVGYKERITFPDLNLNKKNSEGERLKIAWKVTNQRTGEWHIIVTDKNGNYSSNKRLPKTDEELNLINPFDYLDKEEIINLDNVDNKSFMDFKDYKEDDTFLIEELKSTSNKGYDLETYLLDSKGNLIKIDGTNLKEKENETIKNTKTRRDLYELKKRSIIANKLFENFDTLSNRILNMLLAGYSVNEYFNYTMLFPSIKENSRFGIFNLDTGNTEKEVSKNFVKDEGNQGLYYYPEDFDFNYFVVSHNVKDPSGTSLGNYLYMNKGIRFEMIFYDKTNLSEEEELKYNRELDKVSKNKSYNAITLKVPYNKKSGTYVIDAELLERRLKDINADNLNLFVINNTLTFIDNQRLPYLLNQYQEINEVMNNFQVTRENMYKDLLNRVNKLDKEDKKTFDAFLKFISLYTLVSQYYDETLYDDFLLPILDKSFESLSVQGKEKIEEFKQVYNNYRNSKYPERNDYQAQLRTYINNIDTLFGKNDKDILLNNYFSYLKENGQKAFNYALDNLNEINTSFYEDIKGLQRDFTPFKNLFRKMYNITPLENYGNFGISEEDLIKNYKEEYLAELLYKDYIKNATDEELGLLPIPIVRYLIVNTKTSEGEYTPEFLKVLKSRELKDKEFSFDIYDSDNKLIETVNNDKDGNIKFSPIKLNKKDVGKTLEFTVEENTKDKKDYIEYDNTVYKLKIDVKEEKLENGDKKVVGTPSLYYENGDKTELAVFTNTYKSKGEYTPTATKKLEGKKLEDEKFKFTIEGVNTPYKETVENNKDGKIPFSTIKFTQDDLDKEYLEYDIYEEKDTQLPNITNDSKKYKLKLYLTDNGEGKIDVKAESEKDGITFINKYKKPVEEKGSIKIIKSVEGKKDVKEAFDIKIKLGNEERTEKITTEKPIEIKDIKLGTKYNIEEINLPENYELVSIDKAKGEITKDNKDIVVKIVNKYNKPVEKFGSIKIKKIVKGNDSSKEEFHFILTINGKKEKFTLKNNEEKVFNNLPLNSEYELREVDLPENYELESITNDKGIVRDEKPIEVLAVNKYNKPVEKLGSIKVKKLVKGNNSTKEDFHFILTINGREEKFTLKNNEERVFDNIPLDSKYELKEVDLPENYELENISNSKGTVKDEQQINIEVTNLYLNKDSVILNKEKQSKNNTKTGVGGIKIVIGILLVALIAYLIMNGKKKI